MKQERDSEIKKIFAKHNFGLVPEFPFTNDVALNLTNRIEARLSNLENDLQEKKVFFLSFQIALRIKFLWSWPYCEVALFCILFSLQLAFLACQLRCWVHNCISCAK
jgi:hypothetical protein